MQRRALSVLVILALTVAIVAPPTPVRAGWNWTGKTWTTAIIIAAGGAATAYLLAYVSATKRADGSVRQAQAVMDLPMYGTAATPVAQSTSVPSLSMQQLRGLIIASVASAIRNSASAGGPGQLYANYASWRSQYETLRSCWNATLTTAPSAAPSSSPSAAASGASVTAAPATHSEAGHTHDSDKTSRAPGLPTAVAFTGSRFTADGTQAQLAAATSATTTPSTAPASPTPTPLSATEKPTCDDLFGNVLKSYQGQAKAAIDHWNDTVIKANNTAIADFNAHRQPNQPPEPLQTNLPSMTDDQGNLVAFWEATQIDPSDLAGYLSSSPSLMSQLVNENVGSYATGNYVRNLFLATASVNVINAIAAAMTPKKTKGGGAPSSPDWLSLGGTLASDCSGATSASSAVKCLDDLGSIEQAAATAHLQRGSCDWDKHVILPAFSDIFYWATHSGPYASSTLPSAPTFSTPISFASPQPMTKLNFAEQPAIQGGDGKLSTYVNSNFDQIVLTVPSGC